MATMQAGHGQPDAYGGHARADIILGIASGIPGEPSGTDIQLGWAAAKLAMKDSQNLSIVCDELFFKALPTDLHVYHRQYDASNPESNSSGEFLSVPTTTVVGEIGRKREPGKPNRDRMLHHHQVVKSVLTDFQQKLRADDPDDEVYGTKFLVAAADEAPWIARIGSRMGLTLTTPEDHKLPRNNDVSAYKRWRRTAGYALQYVGILRR